MGDAESLLLREVACTEDVSCEVVISGAVLNHNVYINRFVDIISYLQDGATQCVRKSLSTSSMWCQLIDRICLVGFK